MYRYEIFILASIIQFELNSGIKINITKIRVASERSCVRRFGVYKQKMKSILMILSNYFHQNER